MNIIFWASYAFGFITLVSIVIYIWFSSECSRSDVTNGLGVIAIGFVPVANAIVASIIIVVIVREFLTDKISNWNTNHFSKKEKKERNLKQSYRDLRKALIKAGYFKNNTDIQEFVNAAMLMDKLMAETYDEDGPEEMW